MSWENVKLGEVLSHRKGFITIDDRMEYKLCRVQLHRKGVLLREKIKGNQIKTKKQQVCKGGDFLVAEMDAKVGGYGFVPDELDGAIVSSHYFLFELNTKKIRPKYLEVVSKLLILQNQIKATGSTNYAAIRPANVLNWDIPLPNLETQKEIETLYEITSKKGEDIQSEITHQQNLLKQLRQSFLREAMQGKLVKQDKKDGHAKDLLEKVKAEKAKLNKKEKLLPPIKEEEIPFEIPENWVWCRLGEVTNIQRGSSPRPKGDSRYFSKNKTKYNWITISDISVYCKNSELQNTKEYLTKEGTKHSRFVEKNEFIIAVSGSTTGKCCITGISGFIYDGLAVAKIINNGIVPRFLLSYMMCLYSIINASKTGAAFPNINTDYLKNLTFPLPPLSEQRRILQKLDELLRFCDELQTSIFNNQIYTEQFLQIALKEALSAGQSELQQKSKPAFQPLEESHFQKRKALATHIINESLSDNKFGDTKFEKLLYLSDCVAIKRNLGQKYFQKTAGPYDNNFTVPFLKQILSAKWFNHVKRGNQSLFLPANNHSKSKNTSDYFTTEELERVNKLINYFKSSDYEQPEIVSTLYAVWNNRIIKDEPISDELIKEDFLNWDVQKLKYKDRLDGALAWMRKEGVVPDGWGLPIEKASKKKDR